MSIQSFLVAQTLVAAINNADRKALITKLATQIDSELDRRFGERQSEKLQMALVSKVLMAIAREFTGDTYESKLAYHHIIAEEFGRSDEELRRLDRERQAAYMAEQAKRV